MADLNKIKGDTNLPEPEKAKKKERDLEEIKEKWSKVGKVDPEEQKKKKPKAQQEAERHLKQTEGATPQLGAERKEPSPYEPQTKTPPITRKEAPEAGEPLPPSEPPSYTPETPEPLETEHSQPTQKKKKTHKQEKPAKKLEKEATKLIEKETKPAHTPPLKKKKEEVTQEAPPPPPEVLPKGAWEATKEPEKKKKEEKRIIEPPSTTLPTETSTTPGATPPVESATPAPLAAPFAHLPAQVQALFDRMVGVMTVMHTSGITETTINLDSPKFEGSAFFGAQIVISEFSTAPKAFNIELLGNQNATKLFSENSEDLVAAFEAGRYNFKVNRIDVSSLPATGEAKKKAARKVKRKKT
ncbi:MAG: hypothetical protein P0S96_01975 [Simkaniaceae bacterium]|nr:hypothetical protein [Candidatus Sacchlamyda saccharinae]